MQIEESRYDRAERITWWDQTKLANSRVLVVGAGALGNEIVKNLTLVGVGNIDVVDMDEIEFSNLSRCVFFRDGDEGRNKAQLLAERASQLNPDVQLRAFAMPVQGLGSAYMAQYSAIIGALDNREARLYLSRVSRLNGLLYFDSAIEGLHALVRVFAPDGVCYACTLSEVDWQVLNKRRACSLLQRDDILAGKTPTNATTASLASAIQCQEIIKHLVGRDDLLALVGKVWHLMGEEMATFTMTLSEDLDCSEHFTVDATQSTEDAWDTLGDLMEPHFESAQVVWALDDLVYVGGCPGNHRAEIAGLRSLLKSADAYCGECDAELDTVSASIITQDFPALKVSRSQVTWPVKEYLMISKGERTIAVSVSKGEQ